ncbi:MAG: hypothetical protein NXH75_00665 [Halobacteriovoraceae bacterium]|nr:hypothetical protein [Halobacteriovoraceae bacterium]
MLKLPFLLATLFFFKCSLFASDDCLQADLATLANTHAIHFQNFNSQMEPKVTCYSDKMISIRDKSDRLMDDSKLIRRSGNGEKDEVVFINPSYGELIFDMKSQKASWFEPQLASHFEIVMKDNVPGIMRPRYPLAPERGQVFQRLPVPMEKTYTAFLYKGFEGINKSFNDCKYVDPGEKDFRSPLTSNEVNQCKKLIGKVKNLLDCGSDGNCAEIYQNEFGYLKIRNEDEEKPVVKKMNSEEMYLANAGLSKRAKTIGTLLVADYAVSYGAWGAMAIAATKGYKVLKTATYWGIFSNAFTAVWPFSFDFENCKPPEKGGNLDDCRALNPSRMSSNFQNELTKIIDDPKRFEIFEKSEDGGLGRVVCLSMEHLYLNEAARYEVLPEPRCDKHTVTIGTQNYLYSSDGHLIQRRSGHDSVHFYLDGAIFEENHDTGNIRDLRDNNQSFDSFKVYSEIQADHRNLNLLRPKIQNVLAEESCKRLGPIPGEFQRPN